MKFTNQQLRSGPDREKWRDIEDYYGPGHEPHTNYFYGLLALIYDGITDINEIKAQMRCFFISSTHHVVVEDQDVEEFIQFAKKKKLLEKKGNALELTKNGKHLTEVCYFINNHTSYWMKIFFSERSVMLGTAIFLIIISFLKIFVGIQLGSQGMLNEGFENLTDLIKIGIIVILSFRLKKDKLASFIIIGLMMITGISLLLSSFESLLNPSDITPTIQAYLIGFISIATNIGLLFLKSIVGRTSGNLSLLSDSKDSQVNIYISSGVLIGLTFAVFKYYFVDALVGILIAIIIFKEGIEIIIELSAKEENFDITEIKVFADNIYDNRLTGYLLANIRRQSMQREELLRLFERGLDLGRKYYIGFADFFYEKLGKEIAGKHLDTLIRDKSIELMDDELFLTDRGLKVFYSAKAKEFKSRAKRLHEGFKIRRGPTYCLILLAVLILLIIFANEINSWFASL